MRDLAAALLLRARGAGGVAPPGREAPQHKCVIADAERRAVGF